MAIKEWKKPFPGFDGIAWNENIYLRKKWIDKLENGDREAQDLVFHEAVHLVQQKYFGKYKFLAMYIGYWLKGLFLTERAYLDNPFEQEARYWTAVNGPDLINLPRLSHVNNFTLDGKLNDRAKFILSIIVGVVSFTAVYYARQAGWF